MAELSFSVIKVETASGPSYYVTLLPVELATRDGIAADAIVGVLTRPPGPDGSIAPDTFSQNAAFVARMQDVVRRVSPTLTGFREAAQAQGQGWVYVIDQRTATPGGQVPSTDVVGGFEVQDGHVVEGSYTPNPKHRLLTERGFFRLDPALAAALLESLGASPRPT
jgi:hypothetical protein